MKVLSLLLCFFSVLCSDLSRRIYFRQINAVQVQDNSSEFFVFSTSSPLYSQEVTSLDSTGQKDFLSFPFIKIIILSFGEAEVRFSRSYLFFCGFSLKAKVP